MSSTLTWSEYHGESNVQSTFAATNQGAIQLMNQYFTALAVFADFPWQICSFEGTTSPWFVTLKRKNLSPGRIVIMAVTSAPGSTYNPQLSGGLAWSGVGVRAAWFPSATSDTPANILATSGDVFTNPAGSTGLGPNTSMVTGANLMSCWACEDGIFLRYGSTTGTNSMWVIGNMIEDHLGAEDGISFSSPTSMEVLTPSTVPSYITNGGLKIVSGSSIHLGTGWVVTTSPMYSGIRDNGLKKFWALPRSLYSYQLPNGLWFKYKLRQIAYGPTPLAGFERIAIDGDITKALSTFPAATTGYPWLTNYQV